MDRTLRTTHWHLSRKVGPGAYHLRKSFMEDSHKKSNIFDALRLRNKAKQRKMAVVGKSSIQRKSELQFSERVESVDKSSQRKPEHKKTGQSDRQRSYYSFGGGHQGRTGRALRTRENEASELSENVFKQQKSKIEAKDSSPLKNEERLLNAAYAESEDMGRINESEKMLQTDGNVFRVFNESSMPARLRSNQKRDLAAIQGEMARRAAKPDLSSNYLKSHDVSTTKATKKPKKMKISKTRPFKKFHQLPHSTKNRGHQESYLRMRSPLSIKENPIFILPKMIRNFPKDHAFLSKADRFESRASKTWMSDHVGPGSYQIDLESIGYTSKKLRYRIERNKNVGNRYLRRKSRTGSYSSVKLRSLGMDRSTRMSQGQEFQASELRRANFEGKAPTNSMIMVNEEGFGSKTGGSGFYDGRLATRTGNLTSQDFAKGKGKDQGSGKEVKTEEKGGNASKNIKLDTLKMMTSETSFERINPKFIDKEKDYHAHNNQQAVEVYRKATSPTHPTEANPEKNFTIGRMLSRVKLQDLGQSGDLGGEEELIRAIQLEESLPFPHDSVNYRGGASSENINTRIKKLNKKRIAQLRNAPGFDYAAQTKQRVKNFAGLKKKTQGSLKYTTVFSRQNGPQNGRAAARRRAGDEEVFETDFLGAYFLMGTDWIEGKVGVQNKKKRKSIMKKRRGEGSSDKSVLSSSHGGGVSEMRKATLENSKKEVNEGAEGSGVGGGVGSGVFDRENSPGLSISGKKLQKKE